LRKRLFLKTLWKNSIENFVENFCTKFCKETKLKNRKKKEKKLRTSTSLVAGGDAAVRRSSLPRRRRSPGKAPLRRRSLRKAHSAPLLTGAGCSTGEPACRLQPASRRPSPRAASRRRELCLQPCTSPCWGDKCFRAGGVEERANQRSKDDGGWR
jgi:hypothetical protein